VVLGQGLEGAFFEINPIADFTSKDLELTITDYYLDEPKYPLSSPRTRISPTKLRFAPRLLLLMKKTGEVKEQEIYLGDFPS
jgi:DNA-directed RNA polymerase subunit beta